MTGAPTLAVLLPFCFRRRSLRRIGTLLALPVAVSTITACGTGGNFGKVASGPQAVQINLTAAGTTIPVNLTVAVE